MPVAAEHQGEMPAGAAAGDPEAVGIDLVVARVVADEAHRAVNVVEDLGDGVFRLAPVNDGEDGLSAVGK